MKLTLLNSTHTPTYEYGVIDQDTTIRYSSTSHRECVDYIVRYGGTMVNAKIARHDMHNNSDEWHFDWADD